jgi:hypothetical protein
MFYFWHSLAIGLLMLSSFFWGKSYEKTKKTLENK